MAQIWVKFNGKARGPYSLDSFVRMHDSGEITDEHEMWSDDTKVWKKVSDIKNQKIHINFKTTAETVPEFHNLDVYTPKQEASPVGHNIAGPWRRFFARIFDVWFFAFFVCIPIIFAWAYYAPNSYLSFMPENEVVIGICLLFFVFIIDSITYAAFGNTPGKALLGLKVKKANGEKYFLAEYTIRNLSVWWTGFALGIPLLNLITMFIQFRKVKKTGFASYDADKKGMVVVDGASASKTAFFVLGAIILVVINSIAMSL